jgi:hypothetical protein
MTKVRISSGLIAATREALEILHRHYPRKFALAMQPNDAGAQYVEEYAQALVFCDFDKIPAAARQWVATGKFGPSAAELAEIARDLTFESRPTVASAPAEPPPSSLNKNWERIDALYYAAKERMIERGYRGHKFAAPIGQMWALLYGAQPTPEQQHTVRMGDIELDVWYKTVDAWMAGERPKPHPMNNLGALAS